MTEYPEKKKPLRKAGERFAHTSPQGARPQPGDVTPPQMPLFGDAAGARSGSNPRAIVTKSDTRKKSNLLAESKSQTAFQEPRSPAKPQVSARGPRRSVTATVRARRRSGASNDIVCALCDEPMVGEPEWAGDIEFALALRDGSPGKSRKIHQFCGEAVPELVKNTLQKMNRDQPELRLRMWPWPARSAPYREPLPNLMVCREYFERYKSAQLEVDALRLISDLLLELRSKHSVEWECCGWKSDAITDVVLGHTSTGYVENGGVTARLWFTRHWMAEKKRDREIEARFSPERLRASGAAWDIDHFQLTGKYTQCANFIRWLGARWRKLPAKAPGRSKAAAENFRNERQQSPLAAKELEQIADAYARCTKVTRHPTPSQVMLDFVATSHQVSPRLVASVRSENNKNARS